MRRARRRTTTAPRNENSGPQLGRGRWLLGWSPHGDQCEMRIPHTDTGVPYVGVLAAGLLVVGVAVTAGRFQAPSAPAILSATAANVHAVDRKTDTARVTAQFQAPAPTA